MGDGGNYKTEFLVKHEITGLVKTRYVFDTDKFVMHKGNYLFILGEYDIIVLDISNFKVCRLKKHPEDIIKREEFFCNSNKLFESNDKLYLMRYDRNGKVAYGYECDLNKGIVLIVDGKYIDLSYSKYIYTKEKYGEFLSDDEKVVINEVNSCSDTNLLPKGFSIGNVFVVAFCDGEKVLVMYFLIKEIVDNQK